MLKLYRLQGDHRDYWETWEEATGKHRVHWGTLGTSGESKVIESTLFQKAEKIIQKEVD